MGWPWDAHNGGVEAQKSPEGSERRPVVSDSKRYLNSKRQDPGLIQDRINCKIRILARGIQCLTKPSIQLFVLGCLYLPEAHDVWITYCITKFQSLHDACSGGVHYVQHRAGCIPPASAN